MNFCVKQGTHGMGRGGRFFCIFICVMIFFLAGCSGKEAVSENSPGEEKEELVVGVDKELFPLTFYNGELGDYLGFETDLAREVCRRLELELSFKPVEWSNRQQELESKSVDCIWSGFQLLGDEYTVTGPYIDNSLLAIVRKDRGITSVKEQGVDFVGILKNDSITEALKGNTRWQENLTELIQYSDVGAGFMDLEAGSIDCLLLNRLDAIKAIKERTRDRYTILEDAIYEEKIGIGFAKGNEELRDLIWNELLEMQEDGTMDILASHYEQEGITDCICIIK